MGAADIAEALGLEPALGPELEWGGTRLGLAFGVAAQRRQLIGPEPEVRVFCAHEAPLRIGMLASTAPSWGAREPLGDQPAIAIGDERLDARLRLRAAEPLIARALLLETANALVSLLGDGFLVIDDQRVWLTLSGTPERREVEAIGDRMAALSSRLTILREKWEAEFESAIAPLWSRLATSAGLEWNPDRSTIEGDCHGAMLEARVDAEPCRLYTEIYVEWPSLERGMVVERTEARGSIAWEPPERTDLEAISMAFAREYRGVPSGETGDDVFPAEARHAALVIATTGASLRVDDTGLVTRLDGVAHDEATMGRLFRSAVAITKALLVPVGLSTLYR